MDYTLVFLPCNIILRYRKPLKHFLHSGRAGAGLLCTEAIVFVHWQTLSQTVSHAKHSRDSPPAANSLGWERLLLVQHTAFESAQRSPLVYFYNWWAWLKPQMVLERKTWLAEQATAQNKQRFWQDTATVKQKGQKKCNFTQTTSEDDWIKSWFLSGLLPSAVLDQQIRLIIHHLQFWSGQKLHIHSWMWLFIKSIMYVNRLFGERTDVQLKCSFYKSIWFIIFLSSKHGEKQI